MDRRPEPPLPNAPPKPKAYVHVPVDTEIEQSLLGLVLVRNSVYFQIEERAPLLPEHFADPFHQRMWHTITFMLAGNRDVTPATLTAEMKSDPGLITLDMDYFHALANAAPSITSPHSLANVIRVGAMRRAIQGIGEGLVALSTEPPADDLDLAAEADAAAERLYLATHVEAERSGPENLIDPIDRAIALAGQAVRSPERARILTGMPTVDKNLGGLFRGEATFLGAAPSQGKSALGAQLGLNAARHRFADIPPDDPMQGYATLVFSKEMSSEEWALRYVAQEAQVPADRIMEGRVSNGEFERIVLSRSKFMGLPFFIDGSTSLKVAQMRARAQAIKRKLGRLDLIIVDHLGFVGAANERVDEKQQLKQITKDLKAIAKELDCALLVITHINRDYLKRPHARPVISDLYGSSAIEQNADHIWFIHREEYYLERNIPPQTDQKAWDAWAAALEKAKGKAEIFSAKRRMGAVGTATVLFEGPLVRFTDPDAVPLGYPGRPPGGEALDMLDLDRRTGAA